jgi:hypothetical protein
MSTDQTAASASAQPRAHEVSPESGLITTLVQARNIAADEQRPDLVSALTQELKHVERGGDITVVVAAEVSRGKSLLVNALLGAEGLLPVDIDVSTGVYVAVKHSESPQARVFTRGSAESVTVPVSSLADWISVASNPGNEKGVSYVEVGIPSAVLREGMEFIDTPGVGGLDAVHGSMTLEALSFADALIFVLDASAPISRPELGFLMKATQRIHQVILVMTKTDVFPGWRETLDESRKLLHVYAPQLSGQEIICLKTPLLFQAEKKWSQGDQGAAERLRDRSGIPFLLRRLRQDVLRRSSAIKVMNGHRLAVSVLEQLDAGYHAQISTLSGDTSPLQALQARQKELADLRSSTEGWRQLAARDFARVNTEMSRLLQEEIAQFRSTFDDQIATAWQRGQHLTFSAELEEYLRRVEMTLQGRLADSLRICAGEQAARLGIDDLTSPAASLALPERDRLTARPVSQGPPQLALVGGGLLSGGLGILRSLMGWSPLYAVGGLLGLGLTMANLKTHRVAAEQSEARRLLLAYAERFQRDCRAAIEDAVRAATDTTTEALQRRIRSALDTLQAQIQTLTKQAAQVQHAEAAIANLKRKRATVAKLLTQSQAEISNLSGSGLSAADARL